MTTWPNTSSATNPAHTSVYLLTLCREAVWFMHVQILMTPMCEHRHWWMYGLLCTTISEIPSSINKMLNGNPLALLQQVPDQFGRGLCRLCILETCESISNSPFRCTHCSLGVIYGLEILNKCLQSMEEEGLQEQNATRSGTDHPLCHAVPYRLLACPTDFY